MIKLNKKLLILNKVEAEYPQSNLLVSFYEYQSEASYYRNETPKLITVLVPTSAIGNNFYRSIEQWSIANVSDFANGNYVAGFNSDPLAAVKDRQLAILKSDRDAYIASLDMEQDLTTISNLINAAKGKFLALKTEVNNATVMEDVLQVIW